MRDNIDVFADHQLKCSRLNPIKKLNQNTYHATNSTKRSMLTFPYTLKTIVVTSHPHNL